MLARPREDVLPLNPAWPVELDGSSELLPLFAGEAEELIESGDCRAGLRGVSYSVSSDASLLKALLLLSSHLSETVNIYFVR